MPYSFILTATIPASPEEIYEAWLDSVGHSEMTGGEATMSDQVGAEVSAWDGYISGRNLELVPGERIVQSWRTSEFGDEHDDSIITLVLQSLGDGSTLLTLEHSNVPDEQRSYEEEGWQSNYFEPMAAYFTERKQKSERAAPKKAAAKSEPKAKRVAPVKRAAPKAKTSPRKKKGKTRRKIAAAPKRAKKRVKSRAPKSGRGKRR
ncbi:MAG: SRPBCC domain-containing protein [Xanthobacteraceae bacterium]|nr:SRPBCC domain-containing protein [Xanthobacteraceae bacterium]